MKWVQLCISLNVLWHCSFWGLGWKLTFPVMRLCWVFHICWHIECSTFTASSFRIWNSSAGILSPLLALFVCDACNTSISVACQVPLSMEFPRQEYWSGFSIPFSTGSSQPRDQTRVSCIAGRFFTIWGAWEDPRVSQLHIYWWFSRCRKSCFIIYSFSGYILFSMKIFFVLFSCLIISRWGQINSNQSEKKNKFKSKYQV